MPGFSFTTIEPNQIGQVTKWDVPINDWLGLKFGSGQNDTLGHQFRNRVEDDIYDDKSEASVDVLNRAYGIDDRLKFTEPMSIQRARLINERKRSEIESQSYFESASHSWFSGKAVAGFGAAMVGSLSHPLDLGLSFLPFVGSEKAAAGVAKMGGGQLERMAARGLLTEERLAKIGVPLPRLSGAMIDGAVNQLAMEVPIAFQKNRDMANYDSSDFAFNVLAGGAFAGGVKSIGLAFERAAKAWTSLDPKIRDAAPLKALREIFTREPAGFDADLKLDEATIRSQVTERVRAENPFDEAAVRAGYEGPKADIGSGEPIIRYESKTAKVGEIFEDAGLTYRVSSVKDGQVVAIQTGSERFSQMYSPELEVIAQKEARGIDLTPEEYEKIVDLIDPETPNAHSDFMQRVAQLEDELEIPKLMEEQRRLNLEEYVAQKRAEYDARVKDVADAETKKATENIRKQAKSPLTSEEVQKYTVKAPADDAAIKLVEDEADELIKSVLDSVDSVEDRARLEAEINAELERHGFKTDKKAESKPSGWSEVEGADPKQVSAEIKAVLDKWKARGVTLHITNEGGQLQLGQITVAGEKGKGVGTEAISDVKALADRLGQPVTLTASADAGKQADLERFYQKNGFVKSGVDPLNGKPLFTYAAKVEQGGTVAPKAVDSEAEAIADKLANIGDDTDMITAALELPDEMSKRVMQVIRERNNAKIKELNTKPPEVGVSAEKAIDAMIPCVTAKAKL